MAMKVATFNGCKVYSLSNGKALPQWLSEKKKRAMSKEDDYRRRVDLIQDFEMTTAAQCIKMTKDSQHIIVTGTYAPLIRCYTVSDMAMKFQRGLTCEVVAFECLSDDYGKLVFLLADRTVNFHAPYGTHYSLRVPKFGRDLCYDWSSCDLFIGASGQELYRLNLELGQFREPYTLSFSGCNKVHMNPCHPLLACGGESPVCEFWDVRAKKSVSKLRLPDPTNLEVTALQFDTDGMSLAVGTSNGQCLLYDIRSSKPLYIKDHQYGLPVINVKFHNTSHHVISTDKKIVKIWERHGGNMGKILTNIETPADINDLHVVGDNRGASGLIFVAGEQSRVMTYFVPELGPAPRWCSFLEGITEELEESATTSVYEDFKFLTSAEVADLGATSLIGTPMLKAYMHGYFMEVGLYSKLRAVSKPFEFEEHRKKRIREKIEEKRQSRITALKRLPKVNRDLAEKLSKRKGVPGEVGSEDVLVDDRFSALFKRDEFEQDPESLDYKLRNPTTHHRRKDGGYDSEDDLGGELVEEGFQAVAVDEEEDFDDEEDEVEEDDDSEDGDGDDHLEPVYREDDEDGSRRHRKKSRTSGDDDVDEKEFGQIARATNRILEKKKLQQASSRKTVRMYELEEGGNASDALFGHSKHIQEKRRVVNDRAGVMLEERLRTESRESGSGGKIKGKITYGSTASEPGLSREMSFTPSSGNGRDRFGDEAEGVRGEDGNRGRGRGRGSRGGGRGGMSRGSSGRNRTDSGGRGNGGGGRRGGRGMSQGRGRGRGRGQR